jgi:hypothetical protein
MLLIPRSVGQRCRSALAQVLSTRARKGVKVEDIKVQVCLLSIFQTADSFLVTASDSFVYLLYTYCILMT